MCKTSSCNGSIVKYASIYLIWFLCSLFFLSILINSEVSAKENVVFWLEPRSNRVFDDQVLGELGARADLIVLRAARNHHSDMYTFSSVVSSLKTKAPQVPVLSYAWINRKPQKGRIEASLLDGVDIENVLAETRSTNNGYVKYFDITDSDVRKNLVSRLKVERINLGVDGFAIDGAIRSPTIRPKVLAKVCQAKVGFCEKYAAGMDDLFMELRAAVGGDDMLVYNGLFNFAPGQIEDQSRLLEQADAVAIEYFGMNPGMQSHDFSNDILPYLHVISSLPKNKSILFFGRGPWQYSNYEDDYRWQRYLFASFLLGKREFDYFKYHASFQVPPHKGRTGGLDVYADWNMNLGAALYPFVVDKGLYKRDFLHGLVVVSPDDGYGGKIRLIDKKFDSEGNEVTGEVFLAPGESLILFNEHPKDSIKPVSQVYTASNLASWGWFGAKLVETKMGEHLKLMTLPEELLGEHDLLLDYERSLTPFRYLEIKADFSKPDSAIQVVVEVDDPAGRHSWIVLEISSDPADLLSQREIEEVAFRSPPRIKRKEYWPLFHLQSNQNGNTIVLDGIRVLENTGYQFRRWSHIRFVEQLDVSSVTLYGPQAVRAK